MQNSPDCNKGHKGNCVTYLFLTVNFFYTSLRKTNEYYVACMTRPTIMWYPDRVLCAFMEKKRGCICCIDHNSRSQGLSECLNNRKNPELAQNCSWVIVVFSQSCRRWSIVHRVIESWTYSTFSYTKLSLETSLLLLFVQIKFWRGSRNKESLR